MCKEYCSNILYHSECTRALNTKIPSWSGSDFGLDTARNWSNEFLCFENPWVFRVNKRDDSEFNHADKNNYDIFLIKVAVHTNINHQPYNLGYHQYESNNK